MVGPFCLCTLLCLALRNVTGGYGVRYLKGDPCLSQLNETIWYRGVNASFKIHHYCACQCRVSSVSAAARPSWVPGVVATGPGSSLRVGAVDRLLNSTSDLTFDTVLCALSMSSSTSTSWLADALHMSSSQDSLTLLSQQHVGLPVHDPDGSKAYNDHDHAKYNRGGKFRGHVHIREPSRRMQHCIQKAEIPW